MKQNNSITKRISSGRKSRFLATQQLLHRVVAILVLLCLANIIQAQNYYVLYNGSNYLYNNSGTLAYGAFAGPKSIWIASGELGTTGRTIQSYFNTKQYLYVDSNKGGTASINTNTSNWQVRNNYLCTRSGQTNYYLKYNSGNFTTNSDNNGTRFKNYSVTIKEVEASSKITTNPTISVSSVGTGAKTIQLSHTNFVATSNPAYTRYSFNNHDHYWYDGADHIDEEPGGTLSLNPTYTWSITQQGGTYAEIDGTGKLTLKGNPTSNQTITVQLVTSNIAPFDNQTTTFDLVLTSGGDQNTPSANVSVSFSSINGEVQLQHNDVTSTYTPKYSSFTANGTQYYYYNNKIYSNLNDIKVAVPQNNITYKWSITSGDATIDATTGLLLLNNIESQTVKARCMRTIYVAQAGKNYQYNVETDITTTKTDAVSPKPTFTYTLASDNSGLQLTPKVTSNYIPAYCTIKTGSTTRGYYDGTSYTTAVPTGTSVSDANFAWTATNGNVTGNVLTFNGTSTATVKVTATKGNYYSAESDVTTFTLTEEDPDPEAVTPDIVVTPKTATLGITNQPSLGYSNTQEFSIPETLEAVVKDVPAYTKIVSGTNTYYKHENGKYYTNTPAATSESQTLDFTSATWTASETGYVTITPNANGKTATVVYDGKPVGDDNTRITITANAKYGEAEKSGRAIVSLLYSYIDVTGITATDKNMFIGENDKVSLTITPNNNDAGIVYENFTYSTDPTGIITIDANGTIHAVSPGTTTVTVTYSGDDKPDHPELRQRKAATGASTTFQVTVGIKAPTVEINDDGTFTITDNNVSGSDATIKYTTDGSDPVTSTTAQTGTSGTATSGQTVKAVAIKGDGASKASTVASEFYAKSGVSGGTVVLNDYEDHTWTYYSGVDTSVDGGNYNTNYAGKMYSPNPRNVKITYNATNNAAVSINESETSFVYYKTLEEGATAGQYPYQVISNPFSKRPAHSGSTYYGFTGWKIVSGGEYIKNHDNNDVLSLDEEITFVNLTNKDGGEYTPNCTSAEIVFETTWGTANRTYITTNPGSGQTYTFNSGTYETNFVVINVNYTRQITISGSATIMMVEPDGSANYRGKAFSGSLVPSEGADNTTKIEFSNWSNTGEINAQGRNLTIGRGITHSGGQLYGTNTDENINQILKIESGTYANFYAIGGSGPTDKMTKQYITFGNDYDRANNDNSKMKFTSEMHLLRKSANTGTNKLVMTAKSGSFTTGVTHTTAGASGNCFYLSYNSGTSRTNHRTLIIEGGEFWHIAGGYDNYTSTDVNLILRVKGGIIHGCVYGGAAQYPAGGSKQFVFTGGTVEGWIAGGANGYLSSQNGRGQTNGYSYVYVGGNTKVDSHGDNTGVDNALGGNVFGAGCGNEDYTSAGRIVNGSNVVLADNAFVERGVYGGGAYGDTQATANVYITGGHVASGYDSKYNVFGGVYGGARQKGGETVKIYMTGGQIDGNTHNTDNGGGLFGGSNYSGTISKSVTMQINGGQVGTEDASANIHGGGYGSGTGVTQNIDITLGKTSSARDADGVTVYGDVYGGSALGSVNGTSATNTYHTYVTMNAGYIHGSLYGGALGSSTTAANVYGPVQVKVYGGSVMKTDENGANGSGAVYGCNNINGAPQRAVSVDIYGTNSAPAENQYALYAVYGGGNKANYSYGTPTVTVHNCDNSIEYVYGGGNAANITGNGHGTDVTIWGGNVIGNVFGGGNGTVTPANVAGGTKVTIHGGRILNVYGGSNSQGTIGDEISVTVAEQAEVGHDLCAIDIDNVFGGGNLAKSAAATMSIGCASHIGAVYGGANQANITSGNIDLTIAGGHIDNVFGGNNISGTISGTITVTVSEDQTLYPCGMLVGNVFGAGNLAAYSGSPTVNIFNGHLTGSVFGGGKGDSEDADHVPGTVSGNPKVTIGDTDNSHTVIIDGNVFGGGDAANVQGEPVVEVKNCNTVIGTFSDDEGTIDGTVYGGGNAAHITGEGNGTSVTINGGSIYRVFGGGNGEVKPANIAGDAITNIHAGLIGQVFAGSNMQGSVGGTASATIDHDNTDCNEKIDEVYGGGNLAAGNAGAITVECGAIIGDLYGGANQANVTSDITLNITGGTIDRVFGGNNTSGNVMGSIIVNVEKSATCDLDLGSVFGGGNQAAYSIYGYNTDGSAITSGTAAYNNPQVNIKNGTVKNNVYGGGLGETAKVYGAPQVTIGDDTNDDWVAAVGGDVYGGGDAAEVVGTPVVNVINKCNTTIANVYGGGNAADVSGTDVNIDGGTITGMVFGGGHGSKGDSSAEPAIPAVAANVNGNVNLDVTGGTISKVFAGSNANGNITGEVTFNIEKGDESCDMKIDEVYGGGNEAAGNAATINITCTGGEGEYIHTVYGGANAADIGTSTSPSNIVLNIAGGHIDNVFGGNNTSGNIYGTITVNVNQAASSTECNSYLGNVYGAGNLALYTGNPAVNILNGTVSGNVYGAGKGDATDESHAPGTVTGSPVVIIGDDVAEHTVTILGNVFGGGDAANVVGTPSVTVNDCATTIGTRTTTTTDGVTTTTYTNGTVYGGGNAAHITGEGNGTAVTINGGTINRIFGGGNGEVSPANVAGSALTTIHAGNIHQAFAGSNKQGTIGVSATINVDKQGTCTENIDELYGGGNEAAGKAGSVNISCGAIIGDVYGGANNAAVNSDITLNVTGGTINRVFGGNNTGGNISGKITVNIEKDDDCTTFSLNSVYGAGNQAAYTPSTPGAYPAVNLIKGTVKQNVYGGGLGASATVTSNPTVTLEGVIVNGAIFGGGDAAPVTGNPTVVANYGTSANIFGGGKGETAIVTGGTHVTINQTEGKTLSVVNVFGGGDAAAVAGSGTTLIEMKAGTVANIYGGGNQAGAASTTVNMTGGTVEKTGGATSSGIYGGCNTSGTVTGNIAVNITGGTVGTAPVSETPAVESNVHGGGYGSATATNGDVTVIVNGEAVNIWGDVYGGSALGNVNDAASDQTKVQLDKGTIHGCLYGGGLGAKNGVDGATADIAALVNGTVNVIVNGGTVTEQVFGCNNVNGTPKSNVTVTINGTNAHTSATETTPAVYAISEVYGGGNMANYSPTSTDNACKVIVNNCESSIGYVYGGGNAANVTSTDVTINGGIIGQVFGGGHGNKDATPNPTEANVTGNVAVKVYGGTIEQVFAGSNSKGNIGGTATLTVNKNGTCEMHINEVYGGGNQAAGNAGEIDIISTGGEGEGITDVYGGAREADVTSGITLNIKGGNIGRAFGGNNVSGSVSGAIVVNVNETSTGALNINSVYGAGNQAPYTGNPTVNILNGRINENVFGGGLGATAIVTGDPVVTVGDAANNAHQVEVVGNVFGGGDAAAVEGEPTVTIVVCGTIIDKDVYGGGNAAPVYSTKVYMRAGKILGNVFGGGNGKGADNPGANVGYDHNNNKVTGKDSYGTTYVVINGGTVGTWTSETVCKDGTGGVFGGSNTKGDVWNKSTVQIEGDNKDCPMKVMDVYGAGNEAYMNGTANLEIGCHAPKMEYLFGGAKNADVMNDINLVITNGSFGKVFGGNNMGGRIYGKITVTIDETGCSPILIDELYGGGYNAPYDVNWGKYDASKEAGDGSKNAAPTVNIISFSHIGKVFGGGYGAEAVITGDPVVNIQQIPGTYDPENSTADSEGYYNLNSGNKLGTIDTVFGGGNAANINGNTYVNIGTVGTNVHIAKEGDSDIDTSPKPVGANITGNVYGGGNAADVTGKTNVVVGQPKTTPVTP